MKNIVQLLLEGALVLTARCFAQEFQPVRGTDTLFICTGINMQLWRNGTWKDTTAKRWTYDDNNMLTDFVESSWDKGVLVPTVSNKDRRDDCGRLVEEISKRWDAIAHAWQPVGKGVFAYHEDGSSAITSYRWDGLGFVPYDTMIYRSTSEYDPKGNVVRTVGQSMKHGALLKSAVTDYVRGAHGEILEKITQPLSGDSSWGNRTSYTYDDIGREIGVIYYSLHSKKWEITREEAMSYDVTTNSSVHYYISPSFNRLDTIERETATLDLDGNIRSVVNELHQGHVWASGVRDIYLYERRVARKPIIAVAPVDEKPADFELSHNYPNPFNAVTQIHFKVPRQTFVSLRVYDILGREVSTLVHEIRDQGEYTVQWNGENFATGVYIYRMACQGYSQARKMNLIK